MSASAVSVRPSAKPYQQTFQCPRCRRPFNVTVRGSIVEALKDIGWRITATELVCGHCASLPLCAGAHRFESKLVPWFSQEKFSAQVCATCGQVKAVFRES